MYKKDKKKLMIKLFNTNLDLTQYKDMTFKEAIDEFFYRMCSKSSKGTIDYMNGKLPVIKKQLGNLMINDIKSENTCKL